MKQKKRRPDRAAFCNLKRKNSGGANLPAGDRKKEGPIFDLNLKPLKFFARLKDVIYSAPARSLDERRRLNRRMP